jgi:cytochrome c554/c'-like protein
MPVQTGAAARPGMAALHESIAVESLGQVNESSSKLGGLRLDTPSPMSYGAGRMKGVIAMERVGCVLVLFLAGCSGGDDKPPSSGADAAPDVPQPRATLEQLKDPETCKECHAKHFREWSGSMHAYAAEDPMFLAMNERGQREANIGNFCVQCHAPMAVAAAAPGTVIDTAALMSLTRSQRGVTCYFCHSIDGVNDTHNNPLHLANDGVMRGRFTNAVPNDAHASAYSEFLDGTQLASSRACGSCHDILNDKGAHVERTFLEWQGSVFSAPVRGLQCAQCHAKPTDRPDVIADGPKVQGVLARYRHAHTMHGVDKALTPFPEIAAQDEAVKEFLNFPPVVSTAVCVGTLGAADAKIAVIVDNRQSGHNWPSGASQDRQFWFEVTAYAGGVQIYQSGAVPAGTDPAESDDEDLWLLRDCMFDEKDQETHLFWEAKTIESNTLPAPLTLDPTHPDFYKAHVARAFPQANAKRITPFPERVTLKIWAQPFPYAVVDEFTPELKGLGYDDDQIKQLRAKFAPMQVTSKVMIASDGGISTEPGVIEWTPEAAAKTPGGVFPNSAGLIPVFPRSIQVQCVTGTNMPLNAQAIVSAPNQRCKP